MSTPKTWEQATQDVAAALPQFEDGEDITLDTVLEEIEEYLDGLRESEEWAEVYFRQLAWLGAVGYVREKYPRLTDTENFVDSCNNIVTDVLVLLPKKQHDYGPDNILWGGVQGVVVRAHDKLARILNLKKRAARHAELQKVNMAPHNEPLSDSYFDLIGYGIVGAMLVKGTFTLGLAEDLEKCRTAERPKKSEKNSRSISRELSSTEKSNSTSIISPTKSGSANVTERTVSSSMDSPTTTMSPSASLRVGDACCVPEFLSDTICQAFPTLTLTTATRLAECVVFFADLAAQASGVSETRPKPSSESSTTSSGKGTFQLPLAADVIRACAPGGTLDQKTLSSVFADDERNEIRSIVKEVLAEREQRKLHHG